MTSYRKAETPASVLQEGQAMAEALLVCLALLLLSSASVWLFRAQQVALSVQHASARSAFLAARQLPSASNQSAGRNYVIAHLRSTPSAQTRYRLADQWKADNRRIFQVDVRQPLAVPFADGGLFARMSAHNGATPALTLKRSTAILIDAGHASSDAHTQQRVAQAQTAWALAAHTSYDLAEKINHAMAPVDAAWSRPLLMSEWVGHWASVVPEDTLDAHANKGQP